MRYVDTSVLLAYLTPEIGSPLAEAFMLGEGSALAISSWTELELWSALGVKLRSRQLSRVEACDVRDQFRRLVVPQLRRIAVQDADHHLAMTLLGEWRTTLRGGDSLHLAIASARGMTTYTLDRAMAAAGATLGIPVALL